MTTQRGAGARVAPVLRGVMLAALVAAWGCKPGAEKLSGRYRSTWGPCVVEVRGEEAAIAYPRGYMRCQVEGTEALRCRWESDDARGKAYLKREADHSLRGTWGRGESETDGGAWVLAR